MLARLLWLCCWILAAGCSSAPAIVAGWESRVVSVAEQAPAEFSGAATILDGFDPPGKTGRYATGDRALFGLEFHDGSRVQRWTMLLDVVESTVREDGEPLIRLGTIVSRNSDGTTDRLAFVSELLELRATRLDSDHRVQAESTIRIPRQFLSSGLAAACEVCQDWQPGTELSSEDNAAGLRGMTACRALFDVIQNDEMLSDVLWQIARKPSAWSVVTRGGVAVKIETSPNRAVPLEGRPGSPGTVYRLPIVISANDEPALLVVADVTEPHSPWNLAAGLVAISAQRPGEPDVRLHARLLAARRAPE